MNTQYTKAPWYYDGGRYVREISTDICIAKIEDNTGHIDPEHCEPLPQKANARLIAAAPELLETLEHAMILCEAANAKCTQDTAFIIKARATIKKAKG